MVTTTINDNDQSIWTITGDAVVDEGNAARYTVALSGVLQQGETALVALTLTDVDTGSTDYANFVSAVNAAIGTRTDLSFDGTTLTFTSDGSPMEDLVIDLVAVDDVLVEGVEDYRIAISSASSTSGSDISIGSDDLVTTTINDNDAVQWNIVGDAEVDEGGGAVYRISIDGVLQAGENSTVQVDFSDIETDVFDAENLFNAITAAVASRPELSFDPATGRLTATGTGQPITELIVPLTARDDSVIEGPESFEIQLTDSASTSGVATGIDAVQDRVTTTINDTVGDGGSMERAIWSLASDQIVLEGAASNFQLSLQGNLQAGEVVTVELGLNDVTTTGSDYGGFSAAVADAVAGYAGPGSVAWDGATLSFTSDGSGPMADLFFSLDTVDDGFGEGPEDFDVVISNAGSVSGAGVAIDGQANTATTTIDDSVGPNADAVTWSIIGDSEIDEGGIARYTLFTTELGGGESTTVDIVAINVDTSGADYADFSAAVLAAVDAYNTGANPGTASFDGTSLTFTADADGQALDGFEIELPATDDSLAEGPEVVRIELTNVSSSTGVAGAVESAASAVATTIRDTVGVGGPLDPGGQWSLIGDAVVDEGSFANYTITVSGQLQSGEQSSVELVISDIDTTANDYRLLSTAVADAVASYNADSTNSGSLAWDGTTLTFTSTGDGPMDNLVIAIGASDDRLAEGPEQFNLSLVNPSSSTGINASISSSENQVITTIIDNDQPLWSITGPTVTSEGADAVFTVSLGGTLQAGQNVAIEIDLADLETDSSDYGDFFAAIQTAAASNPDVTFDSFTGTIEYTAPADGATMADLVIVLPIAADSLSESPERFTVGLTGASSSGGLMPTVDTDNATVTTTINGSPILEDDFEFTGVNVPLVSGVLANDSDPDGDQLQVVAVNGTTIDGDIATANGNVRFNANGSYTYTPNDDFSGIDSFVYTVVDEAGNRESATVEIAVNRAAIGIAKSAADAVVNAANPDLWDVTFVIVVENLGDVSLDQLVLLDDINAMVGDAFVSASLPVIDGFVGSGAIPSVNGDWAGDTSQNILMGGQIDPGDRFEVTFTATIDLGQGNLLQGLSNQATASGQGINPDSTPMRNSDGTPVVATDVSDQGSDPASENGVVATDDGVAGNDATEILIADLGIAKSIAETPVLLDNGNYQVTFEVVVANTGTVDLASLTLEENLERQFGDALVNVGPLQLTRPPADPFSNINLNENFDGFSQPDFVDGVYNNVLAVGDSFAVTLTIELNPLNVGGNLSNQVAGAADAVNRVGQALTRADGNPLVARDISDSGVDPFTNNSDSADDTGTQSDATSVVLPPVPLGEISGTVFVDANGNQVFDPGERGIEGVEINLTGSDVFGSAVDLTVLTDSQGNYVFTGLNAGLYEVAEVQPQEFIDGADASPSAALVGNDRLAGLRLGFGQQLSGNNFGEGLSGTSGNPASLPPLLNFGGQLLSNRISDFLAGPGPIYSGVAIESNRSPLALDSGRAVSGGYATEFAGPMSENSSSAMAVDGECCQGVEVTEGEWAGVECAESGVAVDEVVQGDGEILCDRCDEEATACQSCQDCGNCCGCGDAGFPQRGGVLHRISNWLRRR